MTKKDELLNVNLEESRVLWGSAEKTRAGTDLLLVDSGFHASVSTNLDVRLPARLPSAIGPIVDSAALSPSHALAFSPVTPVMTGAARDFRNFEVCPSSRIDLAGDTTDSFSDLCPLVLPHVPADHPASSFATPEKVNLRKKGGPKRQATAYMGEAFTCVL